MPRLPPDPHDPHDPHDPNDPHDPQEPDPAGPPPVRLQASVLGRFSVGGAEGAALGELDSRFHVKALFALLASAPAALDRDELIDALWPGQPAAAARNRLHHTVHLLRQCLAALAWPEEWVGSAGGRVALHPALHSDARCVVQAARRVEAGTLGDRELHEALGHCDAAWMPGLALGEAGERCRHRIRNDQALLLHEGARRGAAAGDTAARREMLMRLLVLQPTDEWACRELMALDLAAGRPNAALAHFEAITRVLAEQLGLRVSAQTAALAHEAGARLASSVGGATAVRPAGATSAIGAIPAVGVLLGREREAAWLQRACAAPGARINLCGGAGIGKSALAAATASALAAQFEAVCWIDAGADGRSAAERVEAAFAGAGAPDASPWRSRRVLLVLDDLDLAAGHTDLLAVLDGFDGPGSAAGTSTRVASVLCISRAPLWAGDNDRVLRLQGLALPPADEDPATAARHASVALFLLRGPAGPLERPRLADVAALVRRLEGVPLAIELAAARTASLTAGELLERLDESLSVLALPPGGPDAALPLRSMEAALARSVQALPAGARALFPQLAVFAAPFTPADLAALQHALAAQGQGHAREQEHEQQQSLQALCDCGLVVPATADHLRVHHLARLHARAVAQAAGLWSPLQQAWLEVLHARVMALDLDWASPGHEDALLALAAMQDALRAALPFALAADPQRGAQLVGALGALWTLHGEHGQLTSWVPKALQAAQAAAAGGRLAAEVQQMHLLLAATLPSAFEHPRALQHAQAAEALARERGDVHGTVHAVCLAADVHCWQGRGDQAREQLAAISREFGLAPRAAGEAPAHAHAYWRWRLHPLGDELRASNLHPPLPTGAAQDALRRAYAGSALWLALLVETCREGAAGGQPAAALAAADETVQRAQRLKASALEGRALWERLWCELALDRLDDCAASARRLRRLWQPASDRRRPLTAALLITELAWRRGQLDAAAAALADAHALAAALEGQAAGTPASGELEHPFARDLALHGALISALRGDVDAAWPAWRAVAGAAATLSPQHLFMASEAAVVLHGVAARAAAVGSLGAVLRELDRFNEATPLVRRFRDAWFGAPAAATVPRDRAEALRLLRGLLRAAAQAPQSL